MFKSLLSSHRKFAAVVLSTCMLTGIAAPVSAFADTHVSHVRSTDSVQTIDSDQGAIENNLIGYATTHNRRDYTATMTDTIKVSPAYGRTIKVYHYDYKTKAWVLDDKVATSDTEVAKVKLTFDDYWKTRSYSAYKIVMDSVQGNGQPYTPSDDGSVSRDEMYSRGAEGLSKKMHTTFNPVKAATAVVMNTDTHQLVYQKNPNVQRKPSSLTKMMTSILLRENSTLNHKVRITSEAARTPWGIGLRSGDTMTTKNLLYAMLLPSANDAACASGIAVGGSTSKFASMMNRRAKELGCKHTVYKNAHGLDTYGNYSTAKDQALIGSFIMTDPGMSYVRKVVRTKRATIYSGKGRRYNLYNSNALLGTGTFKGLKTGTTTLGGYSFCGAFDVDGQTYVSVVLGSTSGAQRFTDTRTLAGLTEYLED